MPEATSLNQRGFDLRDQVGVDVLGVQALGVRHHGERGAPGRTIRVFGHEMHVEVGEFIRVGARYCSAETGELRFLGKHAGGFIRYGGEMIAV